MQQEYSDLFTQINMPKFSESQKRLVFESGLACVIFDGINESAVNINKSLMDIYNLSQKYPDCKFVCSCRILEFPVDKRQYFDSFEVLPVTDNQIKEQFVNNLDELGEKFYQQLKNQRMSFLMDMCRIPLLLSMVIKLLYENMDDVRFLNLYSIEFLTSKYSIYQSFFEHIKKHQSKRQYDYIYKDLKDDFLYCIGYHMQRIGKVFITDNELKGFIRRTICSDELNKDLLSVCKNSSETWYIGAGEFIKKLPFFSASPNEMNQISFIHQSFQEFFAGYFISQHYEMFLSEISELINDPSKKNWEALEFASACDGGDMIIKLIINQAKEHKNQFLIILASKCILQNNFNDINQEIVDNCCMDMIEAFKFWRIPYDYELIYHSQRLFPHVSKDFPKRLERDMEWFTNKYGSNVDRNEYPPPFSIDMLIEIINGTNYEEKLDAIYTMGKRNNLSREELSKSGKYLTCLLESGVSDDTIREEIIKSIKELRYDRAASTMLSIIKSKNEKPSFHVHALYAIANMKYIDAIDDVMAYIKNHNNPYRDSASWTLQTLAIEANNRHMDSKVAEIKEFYFECLLRETDDTEGVFAKGNMVYSLSVLNATEYLPQIIDWLATQQDAYVIEDGLSAVIALGKGNVKDIVLPYQVHTDLVVRRIAQKYLKENDREQFDKKTTNKRRFRIALSFPGEYRDAIIDKIASGLTRRFSKNEILYDKYHEEEFGKPDLDLVLQKLYRDEADIIALFLCEKYDEKSWCGVECRGIRSLMHQIKEKNRIMLFRLDSGAVDGFDGSIDGFIDITASTDDIEKAISYIFKRYDRLVNTDGSE
jgi:hypothetical protein